MEKSKMMDLCTAIGVQRISDPKYLIAAFSKAVDAGTISGFEQLRNEFIIRTMAVYFARSRNADEVNSSDLAKAREAFRKPGHNSHALDRRNELEERAYGAAKTRLSEFLKKHAIQTPIFKGGAPPPERAIKMDKQAKAILECTSQITQAALARLYVRTRVLKSLSLLNELEKTVIKKEPLATSHRLLSEIRDLMD